MTKANRWAWLISLVAITGAVMVLAFLLSIATGNRAFYERHYPWLFWVNTAVAGFLVLVIGIAALRLLLRVKRGKFGSRLLLKLAAIFALVGVIPGVLIYTVSYQFVSRSTRVTTQLEGLEEDAPPGAARIRALAFIPSTTFELAQQRYLLVTQPLPTSLTANALAVQSAYREYQQRELGREGLRKMYIGTLTLTLILAVFGALLLAVTLSNQLARPLLLLAEGMRQVAEGDLTAKPVFASRDELGGLTRSFARMTTQLSEARELVQRSGVP